MFSDGVVPRAPPPLAGNRSALCNTRQHPRLPIWCGECWGGALGGFGSHSTVSVSSNIFFRCFFTIRILFHW